MDGVTNTGRPSSHRSLMHTGTVVPTTQSALAQAATCVASGQETLAAAAERLADCRITDDAEQAPWCLAHDTVADPCAGVECVKDELEQMLSR